MQKANGLETRMFGAECNQRTSHEEWAGLQIARSEVAARRLFAGSPGSMPSGL